MEQKAVFAAGCFWGTEAAFSEIPGVIRTRVGYTGGTVKQPTYAEVCAGGTGHAEAVEAVYDPEKVSYAQLLDVFWRMHNPTERNRQGPDIGTQYRSVIFYGTEEEKRTAERSKRNLQKSGVYTMPVVTEILPAEPFYEAEEYHQKYLQKQGGKTCRT